MFLAEWDLSKTNFRLTHPDEPPPTLPPLLDEFWRFRRYGLPPLAGGMRDQPLGFFENGEQLAHAYRVWRAWMASDKSAAWREAHPADAAAAQQLRRMVYG